MSADRAVRWLLILLGLCALVNLVLFGWGLNRGLDMKDESFMLLCYRFPEIYAPGLPTSFQIIVDRLFGHFDFGLLQYRIAGFFLRIVSVFVFSGGLWLWLRSQTGPEEIKIGPED